MSWRQLTAFFVVLAFASSAFAADGNDLTNWRTTFEAGIGSGIVADPEDANNNALYLGRNDMAAFRFTVDPNEYKYGSLSMDVYDLAKNGDRPNAADPTNQVNVYGPRWGMMKPGPDGNSDVLIATNTGKSTLLDPGLSNSPSEWYMYSAAGNGAIDTATLSLFGAQRLDDRGTAGAHTGAIGRQVVDMAAPGDELIAGSSTNTGQGMWSTWTFDHPDANTLTLTVSNVNTSFTWNLLDPNLGSPDPEPSQNGGRALDGSFSGSSEGWADGVSQGFNGVYLKAGRDLTSLGYPYISDVYIDNILFQPTVGDDVLITFGGEDQTCAIRGSEGDFNCDSEIGLLDLDILGQNWASTGLDTATSYELGDANADGEVGLLDLDVLGQNWGQSTSIPEPATVGLLVIGGLIAVRRR